MLRIEFHCHTIYSKDSLVTPEKLLRACQKKGIHRMVITDHNSISGAREAYQIEPQRVIIGEEIMTTQGELLAAFVREAIPPGLPPQQAIALLKEQGAFISVSHPFDDWRGGHWEEAALVEILPQIDAIEIFNSRCISPRFNQKAAAFARLHHLPGTAGSDAHTQLELGRALMILPDFENAEGLRQVIGQAKFQARLSSPLVHFFSRYAKGYKKLFVKSGYR